MASKVTKWQDMEQWNVQWSVYLAMREWAHGQWETPAREGVGWTNNTGVRQWPIKAPFRTWPNILWQCARGTSANGNH